MKLLPSTQPDRCNYTTRGYIQTEEASIFISPSDGRQSYLFPGDVVGNISTI